MPSNGAPSSKRTDEGREDLAAFVADVTGKAPSRIEESFGDGFVRLDVSEAERRQAAHDIRWVEDAVLELLRNAREAGARNIYVASSRERALRQIVVVDDGIGIPPAMHERIFEARVTSKLDTMAMDAWGVHGRGMALYSISQNAEEARVAASATGLGSSIAVGFDTERLSERADQSTWPKAVDGEGDEGARALKGPHNIIRICVEFALEEDPGVEVYLGSPAEIVATLRERARQTADEASLLFARDLGALPLATRLLAASDARELEEQAHRLGIELSERTAHRILAGHIKPLRSVRAKVRHTGHGATTPPVDLGRDQRGLELSEADARELAERLARAFESVAPRYFITLREAPQLRVGPNKVVATFTIASEEEG